MLTDLLFPNLLEPCSITLRQLRFSVTESLLYCVYLQDVVNKLYITTIGRLPDRNSGRNRINDNSVNILWINQIKL